jgi:MFS family permease
VTFALLALAAVSYALLALAAVSYALLQSLVAPALPDIQRSLHASVNSASWVLTAYLLCASIATPIIGRLGDMHGKVRLLVVVLAGPIVQHLSIHFLFWLPVIVLVPATVAIHRFVPESPVLVPGKVNWSGAALMSGGLAAVLLAVSEAPVWHWLSARTLTVLAVGIALLIAWVRSETRSEHPLVDMRMMRIRGVWTTNAVAALLGFGMYSSFILLPEFVEAPSDRVATRPPNGFTVGFATCALVLALGVVVGLAIPQRRPADAFGPHEVGGLTEVASPNLTPPLERAGRGIKR